MVLVRQEQLTPSGGSKALVPQSYAFNNNNTKLLIFTNTARVWRYNTRGDYWILDIIANKLKQLGKDSLPIAHVRQILARWKKGCLCE